MDSPTQTVGLWLLLAAMAGSTVVCFRLFQQRFAGQPFLSRQPRRPVPWSGWLVAVILGFPALNMLAARLTPPSPPPVEETVAAAIEAVGGGPGPLGGIATLVAETAIERARQLDASERFIRLAWTNAAGSLLMTGLIYLLLVVVYRASRADLGWPSRWAEVGRDAWVGMVGWLTALAPVLLLNISLHLVFQPETQHPFIEQAMSNPSLGILLAVAVSAVVVAPLFEETVFRLLLQGWLESAERRHVIARGAVDAIDSYPTEATRPTGWGGLPVGWTPMLCSSVLFGLAHWGHGLDPIPLIGLGLILGYIYQRTHRVLPCMILHALFNAFTVSYVALMTQT